MTEFLIGMATQAFIGALLTRCGLITPSPRQQFLAGLMFLGFAIVSKYINK